MYSHDPGRWTIEKTGCDLVFPLPATDHTQGIISLASASRNFWLCPALILHSQTGVPDIYEMISDKTDSYKVVQPTSASPTLLGCRHVFILGRALA